MLNLYPRLVVTPHWRARIHALMMDGKKTFILDEATELPEDLLSFRQYRGSLEIYVGDICVANRVLQQLLKFVEDTQCRLTCFASQDRLGSPLLSRFLSVTKETIPAVNQGNSFEGFVGVVRDKRGYSGLLHDAPQYLPLFVALHGSRLPVKNKIFGAL